MIHVHFVCRCVQFASFLFLSIQYRFLDFPPFPPGSVSLIRPSYYLLSLMESSSTVTKGINTVRTRIISSLKSITLPLQCPGEVTAGTMPQWKTSLAISRKKLFAPISELGALSIELLECGPIIHPSWYLTLPKDACIILLHIKRHCFTM